MQYKNTFGTVLANFIEQLPENMEKAKEVLNAEGYEISVVPPREGSTVTFKIQKIRQK